MAGRGAAALDCQKNAGGGPHLTPLWPGALAGSGLEQASPRGTALLQEFNLPQQSPHTGLGHVQHTCGLRP